MTEIFTNPAGPPPSNGTGPSDKKINFLIGGAVVFLVIALGVLGWVLIAGGGDDSNVATSQDNEPTKNQDAGRSVGSTDDENPPNDKPSADDPEPNDQVTLPSSDSVTSAPTGGGGGTPAGGSTGGTSSGGGSASGGTSPVRPSNVSATNTRASVPSLRCTKQPLDYIPQYLIDGDPQTGWGASKSDGAGQSAQFDFGGTKQITTVGLTPGYLRVAERSAANCEVVSAFPYNRFIESVRWEFSDGSSVDQSFEQRGEMQTITVNKQTSFVRMVIVSTSRPAGADDDTVISEAEFTGTP